jgi:hypothetical protein
MNIEAYIKDFYQNFIHEYKSINAAKNSMLDMGYNECHYNDISPASDLIYPSNKNYFYKRDHETTNQNKFIGTHLYTKESTTSRFFDHVSKNPILNLIFSEKDNFNYKMPTKHEYFKTFCNKFSYLTDLYFVSPSTCHEIRFEFKKITLLILDTPRRKSITTNKYFTIKIHDEQYQLKDQFNAMYFLTDTPISILNPYYPNLFMYAARFEFEKYLNLMPKAAML